MTRKKLSAVCRDTALAILDMSYARHIGHIGSALSISDLLSVLYADRMHISKSLLSSNRRDRFILSKGHAAAALYANLNQKGILSDKQFQSFARNDGLCEHPVLGDPGVEMTSGSLGHGLGFAAGIAWGLKKKAKDVRLGTNTPHVFVLISDGECGEGSVWEAALFASRMKLDNLTVIIDTNGWQCFGETEKITAIEPLAAKWRAFGFGVVEIDGHNIAKIRKAYKRLPLAKGKPSVIIARTTSGHGIPLIEDKLIGHYKVFTEEEYRIARTDLARAYQT